MNYSPDHNVSGIRRSGQIGIISAALALALLIGSYMLKPNQSDTSVRQIQSLSPAKSDSVVLSTVPTLNQYTTGYPAVSTPSSAKLISDTVNPEIWFPSPSDVLAGLTPQEKARKITNADAAKGRLDYLEAYEKWKRIIAYDKVYSHPNQCSPNNLRDVYVEIIFFQDSEGSKGFLDATSKLKLINSVGNEACFNKLTDSENNCPLDKYLITFMRYNVITIVRIRALSGIMNENQAEEILTKVATSIDTKLIVKAK
jgi:hypothetical protein